MRIATLDRDVVTYGGEGTKPEPKKPKPEPATDAPSAETPPPAAPAQ
ncbi:MAG: hypothetical protein SH859_01405 [Hyphomicrobium aestuarii]|nr:hypothetical protein [Hyphomicrobium aestuarii]